MKIVARSADSVKNRAICGTNARTIGYAVMRSDAVPKLEAATRLYEALGFVRRDAYYETPVAETIFMELALCGLDKNSVLLLRS